MLGKLLKNEFKATYRYFIPLYALLLVATGFMKIMGEITSDGDVGNAPFKITDIIYTLGIITWVLALLAVIFGTVVLIARRFYVNLLKDEGYLSFTLPVSTGQQIASKVLSSYLWIIASVVAVALAFGIMLIGDSAAIKELQNLWTELVDAIRYHNAGGEVVKILFSIIIGIYSFILLIYTCFSVGQMWNKHRIGGAILTFFVLYIIQQIIGAIYAVTIINKSMEPAQAESGLTLLGMTSNYELILMGVEAVVYTVITHFVLSKKLNLE